MTVKAFAVAREPALILGAVGSLCTLAAQVWAGGLSWEAAVPLAVAAITRLFVTPTGKALVP